MPLGPATAITDLFWAPTQMAHLLPRPFATVWDQTAWAIAGCAPRPWTYWVLQSPGCGACDADSSRPRAGGRALLGLGHAGNQQQRCGDASTDSAEDRLADSQHLVLSFGLRGCSLHPGGWVSTGPLAARRCRLLTTPEGSTALTSPIFRVQTDFVSFVSTVGESSATSCTTISGGKGFSRTGRPHWARNCPAAEPSAPP